MSSVGVVFFVSLALFVPFLLYLAVRSEHSEGETMDRQQAETIARRDTAKSQKRTDRPERQDDDSGWD
jgi:hypothetical protein